MRKPKLVVIGNGMVGQRFLEELVERGHPYDITVFCEESRPAYDRVQLSSYFSGASAEDLALTTLPFFDANGIRLMLNERAMRIDRGKKLVLGSRGSSVAYDELVLATGSFPFVPPISGNDRECCHVYRTIDDLDAIRTSASVSKVGVVVGGGLLGLEAAKALKDLGLEVLACACTPARLLSVSKTAMTAVTKWCSPMANWKLIWCCSLPASGHRTNWPAIAIWLLVSAAV